MNEDNQYELANQRVLDGEDYNQVFSRPTEPHQLSKEDKDTVKLFASRIMKMYSK